jgi:hypothetical protein
MVRSMASKIHTYAPDARVLTTYYCGMNSLIALSDMLIISFCSNFFLLNDLLGWNYSLTINSAISWLWLCFHMLLSFHQGPSDAPLGPTPFEAFVKVPKFLRPHTQIYCTRYWGWLLPCMQVTYFCMRAYRLCLWFRTHACHFYTCVVSWASVLLYY